MRYLRPCLVPFFYLRQTNIFSATRKRIINPIIEQFHYTNDPSKCPIFSFLDLHTTPSTFCTSSGGNDDTPEDGLVDSDKECDALQLVDRDEDVLGDVERIVGIFRDYGTSIFQAKRSLEEVCDVKVTSEVVCEVLRRFRSSWDAAYTFFLWAGKQPGYEHSIKELHLMIALLGNMRKFDTAWGMIEEMRGIRTGRNLVTHQTLLIMIRKYCAVHDVGKAISAFYAHKKFKLEVGLAEFQNLLCALCKYKNVKDAEYLVFANTDVYPIDTKTFNIILNGWCIEVGNMRQGKRIWLLMKERKIKCDSYSYAIIITGFSKGKNKKVVFELFNEMKESGVEPDKKVYEAVIHTLAKANCLSEARHLMETMEAKGIFLNNVTYNSLIFPFCQRNQLDTAKELFDEMIEKGISPCLRTYHALFHVLTTGEEVFELLQSMYSTNCHPKHGTYVMLIKKFSEWRQINNAYKIWNEMSKNGLDPDSSSYNSLIHGLFRNSKLAEAHQYYLEMIKKHFRPDRNVEEMIQAYLAGKKETESHMMDLKNNPEESGQHGETDILQNPETRKTKREDRFSFMED